MIGNPYDYPKMHPKHRVYMELKRCSWANSPARMLFENQDGWGHV